jgi:ankyrin repeat protein
LQLLISFGADLSQKFEVTAMQIDEDFILDPFCFAFMNEEIDACRIILEHGTQFQENMFELLFTLLEKYEYPDHTGAMVETILSWPCIQDAELRTRLIDFTNDISSDAIGESADGAGEGADIVTAVKYANEAAFEQLLSSATHVEGRNSEGETALYVAIWTDQKAFASRLLQRGADLHAATLKYDTPLLLAYKIRGLSVVQEVFGSHRCLDLTNVEKYQVLQIACTNCDEHLLQHLFSRSDNLKNEDGPLPLHTVRPITSIAILRILNRHGILHRTESYRSMLYACENGEEELLREAFTQCTSAEVAEFGRVGHPCWVKHNLGVIRLLLKSGLSTMFDMNEMLLKACEVEDLEVVELLLSYGADANFLEKGGDCEQDYNPNNPTPLHLAVFRGHPSLVDILLDFNANPRATDIWGATPLHVAVMAGRVDIVERLLNTSVQAEILVIVNCAGLRPLHIAAAQKSVAMCQILLKAGARPDHLDNHGFSPLLLAINSGRGETAELLLEAGASTEIHGPGVLPPLHASVRHTHILSHLLAFGADCNALDRDGNTALHLAAESSNCAVIHLILERKPDLATVNRRFMTALDVIEENKQDGWEVGAALLRYAGTRKSGPCPPVDCSDSWTPVDEEDDQGSGVATIQPRQPHQDNHGFNDATLKLETLCASRRASCLRTQALLEEMAALCGAQPQQSKQSETEMPIRTSATAVIHHESG